VWHVSDRVDRTRLTALDVQSLSRSDRSDPNEKDRLITLEQFLIDRMYPSDREML
jgi:hypothetical protein